MIYFFRGLTVFSILNMIPLILWGGSGGMIPIWVIMALAAFSLSFRKCYEFIYKRKWVRAIFAAGIIFFVVIEGMIIAGGIPTADGKGADYIIVLGAQVRGNKPSATLKYRLDAAYEYLTAHPETKAVLSGGQGADEIMPEAEAMHHYLVNLGIAEDRLRIEDESHTTRENLINSFEIIDSEEEGASISVVSNSFHLLRARMQARELGKKVGSVSAANYPYLIPNYYFREFFAVVKEILIYVKVVI